MQDAKRVQEQVDEMALRAETKAGVAEDHRKIATERKELAERELTKFRLMHEIFTLGQQVLAQRKEGFANAEEPPSQAVRDGLDEAVKNMAALQEQSKEALLRNEGSFSAFSAFEETLKNEAVAATARVRGLAVQGERAVGVAESRTGPPEEQVLASSTGFLDQLEDSAKEPMGAPRQEAPKKGSAPPKPEP